MAARQGEQCSHMYTTVEAHAAAQSPSLLLHPARQLQDTYCNNPCHRRHRQQFYWSGKPKKLPRKTLPKSRVSTVKRRKGVLSGVALCVVRLSSGRRRGASAPRTCSVEVPKIFHGCNIGCRVAQFPRKRWNREERKRRTEPGKKINCRRKIHSPGRECRPSRQTQPS